MPKPFKQGHLDGLCGVYSVVNAIYSILPPRKPGYAENLKEELFRACLASFKSKEALIGAILGGIDKDELINILKSSKKYLGKLGLVLDYEQLTLDCERINVILRKVREDKDYPNTAIIVGIESDDMAHWTVIKEIRNNSLIFHDSCSLKEISIEDVQVKTPNKPYREYRIPREEVFSIWINNKD